MSDAPPPKRGRKPRAGSKRNGGVIVTAVVSPDARALIARACAELGGLTIGEVLTMGAAVLLGKGSKTK